MCDNGFAKKTKHILPIFKNNFPEDSLDILYSYFNMRSAKNNNLFKWFNSKYDSRFLRGV